jgi:RNA polymerase sigma factor (sigma-70 family)
MSDETNNEDVERRIDRALDAEEYREAVALALDTYGGEWFGYLVDSAKSKQDADEIYGRFSLDLLEGIADFKGESTVRTWGYAVLRNARNQFYRKGNRRAKRKKPLQEYDELSQIVDRTRSKTNEWKKTSVKDNFARLIREELGEEDRDIVTLRVDRKLGWKEVARVMLDQPDPSPSDIRRESRRVRKRFERAKEKIREIAEENDLL